MDYGIVMGTLGIDNNDLERLRQWRVKWLELNKSERVDLRIVGVEEWIPQRGPLLVGERGIDEFQRVIDGIGRDQLDAIFVGDPSGIPFDWFNAFLEKTDAKGSFERWKSVLGCTHRIGVVRAVYTMPEPGIREILTEVSPPVESPADFTQCRFEESGLVRDLESGCCPGCAEVLRRSIYRRGCELTARQLVPA